MLGPPPISDDEVVHPQEVLERVLPHIVELTALAASQVGNPEHAKEIIAFFSKVSVPLVEMVEKQFGEAATITILGLALSMEVESLLKRWMPEVN